MLASILCLLLCFCNTSSRAVYGTVYGGSDVNVCLSAGCTKAAAHILNSMDPLVDPCHDFYSFACGGWIDRHPIPDEKLQISLLLTQAEKVFSQLKYLILALLETGSSGDGVDPFAMPRQMYAACMDIDRQSQLNSKPLFEEMEELGEFPMLNGPAWCCDDEDMTNLLSKLQKDHFITPFFQFTPEIDLKNTSRYVLHIGKPTDVNPAQFYLDGKIINAFKNFYQSVVTEISMDNRINPRNMTQDIENVIDFEKRLAEIVTPDGNPSNLYNPRKLKDLKSLIRFIRWDEYLDVTLPVEVRKYIGNNTDIIVKEFEFFPKLEVLLNKTSCRTKTNFLFIKIITEALRKGILSEKYKNLFQDIKKVLIGQPERPKLWQTCLVSTESSLGPAVATLYARKYFNTENRDETMSMIKDHRATFLNMIKKLDWMDCDTKRKAKQKVVSYFTGGSFNVDSSFMEMKKDSLKYSCLKYLAVERIEALDISMAWIYRWIYGCQTTGHAIDISNASILSTARYFKQLYFKESFFISMNDESTLNDPPVKSITPAVGWDLDAEHLQDFYKLLKFNSSDSYYKMRRQVDKWQTEQLLKELLIPVDIRNVLYRLVQRAHVQVHASPFYAPQLNMIGLSAAILQEPVFDAAYPKYINYGAIGSMIGHEITHAFDHKGRQYDHLGNFVDWWKNETAQKYVDRTECLIEQYSKFEVEGTGSKINGVLTLDENIADNVGIKESFLAYRRYIDLVGREESRLPGLQQLTGDQLFFLSSAQLSCTNAVLQSLHMQLKVDPHSPSKARVNVPFSNLVQFGQAFQCPIGTRMNPENKCDIW